nr:hypothetical protein GCM10017745_51030 [Saccharothrix mutabilis subsp. capreolus]
MADRAARAATAASDYAAAAAHAASRARDAARRAAENANAAAQAAEDAAGHAGNSTTAAADATRHAEAATTAAQAAVDAATEAGKIFDAARAADTARLAVQYEQAVDAARAAATAARAVPPPPAWDLDQASRRDPETNRLIAEATTPGADPGLVVSHGRRIALTLAGSPGPWTSAAANAALVGSDDEVRAWVTGGMARAAGRDDRLTLTSLADQGSQAFRQAAKAALEGSDADVARLLRERDYRGRDIEDRVKVNQVLAQARGLGRTVTAQTAQRALDNATGTAYRAFLTTGRYRAGVTDDRVKVNQIISQADPTSETWAMAQAALNGPPAVIRQFLEVGRHTAARHDADTAAHLAEVRALLATATSAAATATGNALHAHEAAARARGAAAEADGYARQASESATQAAEHARQAHDHATAAEQSAQQAAESAKTARTAADTAAGAAREATRSAVWAQASATQAAGHAHTAVEAARRAYTSALAAGRDATDALKAAEQADAEAVAKANDEIVQDALARAEHCNARYGNEPAKRDDCIHQITETPEEQTERAYRNGQLCDILYGHQRRGPIYDNCTADVLSPDFHTNRGLEFAEAARAIADAAATAIAIAGLITVVATVAVLCVASVVCGGVLLALTPEAMLFYPAWVTGAYAAAAGATAIATGVRITAQLETATVESRTTSTQVSRLAETLAQLKRRLRVCEPNSFTPDTRVLMADGTAKPISQIHTGDQVTATDPETGDTAPHSVAAVITGSGIKHLVDITVGDAGDHTGTITATHNHPFWVENRGSWTDASLLRENDQLRDNTGLHHAIQRLTVRADTTTVHNLTVERLHTYYVLAGQTPVLVHNNGSCGTGTVWDDIVGTQPVIPGTGGVPKSFELTAGGKRVWVHGNVTDHFAEMANSMAARGASPEMIGVASQQQLRSLQAAVADATRGGVRLNQRMTVGGWQLEFRKAPGDALPVLIHGRYVG